MVFHDGNVLKSRMAEEIRSKLGTLGYTAPTQLRDLVLFACREIERRDIAQALGAKQGDEARPEP